MNLHQSPEENWVKKLIGDKDKNQRVTLRASRREDTRRLRWHLCCVFLQEPCEGEEPGTRELGLRSFQTRVAEA